MAPPSFAVLGDFDHFLPKKSIIVLDMIRFRPKTPHFTSADADLAPFNQRR